MDIFYEVLKTIFLDVVYSIFTMATSVVSYILFLIFKNPIMTRTCGKENEE